MYRQEKGGIDYARIRTVLTKANVLSVRNAFKSNSLSIFDLLTKISFKIYVHVFINIFNDSSKHYWKAKEGLSLEIILPSIIGTISTLCCQSTADSLDNPPGLAIFTSVVGEPRSGKTPAMSFVTTELCKMVKFAGIPNHESMQVNCPTIESLIRIMVKNSSVLCENYYL